MGVTDSVLPKQSSRSRADFPGNSREELLALQEKLDLFGSADFDDTEFVIVDSNGRKEVSAEETDALVKQVLSDSKNRLALNAISANNPATVLQRPSTVVDCPQVFNVTIPHEGSPVTNQRASGRCWLFASTNIFRIAVMRRHGLESFELSQSYLFFWDKVEKANYFLENTLETANEPINSRLVSALMASPVQDGGQWDMVVNLVSKYGLVPQALYPDSWNAMNSSFMDRLLTTQLREEALKLRELKLSRLAAVQDSIATAKKAAMAKVVRILTLTLGPPPPQNEKFTWEFYDKAKQYTKLCFTPVEFAESLRDRHGLRACGGTDVQKLISLVNDPRNEYKTLLTVNRLGNVWGGQPVTYVNVDKATMKKACVEMLKNGWPVFFGSDIGQASDSGKGVMDTNLIDYELGFGIKLGLTKAQRLATGESAMTHAMVLTAVHLSSSGEPIRWRVENSWSSDAGTDGYFVMSDKWMDEFCYQTVVDPKVISGEIKDVLKQIPKILSLWDPMGALA